MKKNAAETLFRLCNIALGLMNVSLFLFWLTLIKIDGNSQQPKGASYLFEHLALQISILEAVMAFGGILLAVMGFLGYQFVVERAEEKADKIARSVVSALHQNGDLGQGRQTGSVSTSLSGTNDLPSINDLSTAGATREED